MILSRISELKHCIQFLCNYALFVAIAPLCSSIISVLYMKKAFMVKRNLKHKILNKC